MAFKMKNVPYGAKSSGGYDMKPRKSTNFDKSGMKNADGSDVKPGAPGFFGKLLDPLGLKKKIFGGGKGKPCPPAGDPKAAAAAAAPPPTGAAPVDPAAAAGAGGAAAPAAAPAPEEVPAPTQMRKQSPATHRPIPPHKNPHKKKTIKDYDPRPKPPHKPRPNPGSEENWLKK